MYIWSSPVEPLSAQLESTVVVIRPGSPALRFRWASVTPLTTLTPYSRTRDLPLRRTIGKLESERNSEESRGVPDRVCRRRPEARDLSPGTPAASGVRGEVRAPARRHPERPGAR